MTDSVKEVRENYSHKTKSHRMKVLRRFRRKGTVTIERTDRGDDIVSLLQYHASQIVRRPSFHCTEKCTARGHQIPAV